MGDVVSPPPATICQWAMCLESITHACPMANARLWPHTLGQLNEDARHERSKTHRTRCLPQTQRCSNYSPAQRNCKYSLFWLGVLDSSERGVLHGGSTHAALTAIPADCCLPARVRWKGECLRTFT
eukprot:3455468-Amphidinium_carterae.1